MKEPRDKRQKIILGIASLQLHRNAIVSAKTTVSQVIWLGLMVLQSGGRTGAHVHEHHETAPYMMSCDVLGLFLTQSPHLRAMKAYRNGAPAAPLVLLRTKRRAGRSR